MTKITSRAPASGAAGDGARSHPGRAATSDSAERRRQAFRELLAEDGINASELSRLAGMLRPNALHNFLNGQSGSLSQRILEQILRARPHWSPARLLGHQAEEAAHQLHATDDEEALPVLGTIDADSHGRPGCPIPDHGRRRSAVAAPAPRPPANFWW